MDGERKSGKQALLIGLVHPSAPLSVRLQAAALTDAGCEMVLEVAAGAEGSRSVSDLLQRLGPGSRIFLTGLEAINRPLPETLRVLAGLLDAGVEVCIVDQRGGQTLSPQPTTAQALRAVAMFASNERSRSTSAGGRPPKSQNLSKIQVQFARRLHASGESPRTIGLICRASPEAVLAALGETDEGLAAAE